MKQHELPMHNVKYKEQSSFSISTTLPRPPEECRIVSVFPQIHGKLDISPGMAAQHKRNVLKKSHPLYPLQQLQFPVQYECSRYSSIIPFKQAINLTPAQSQCTTLMCTLADRQTLKKVTVK